jgi:hypothetical protein
MTSIRIHAVLDGVAHPLDTRERMFAWFGRPPAAAAYAVSYRGRTYPFDGTPFGEPTSPSGLVSMALSRIPGNAPRHPSPEWSLHSDFTRGQCGWLALALAERSGGRTMICGVLPGSYHEVEDPIETDTEWYLLGQGHMDWFMHAGVLVGDRVYCAGGRADPDLWAYGIARSEDSAMCGLVTPEMLRDGLDPLPEAVTDTIPDVVELLMQLIGDEDEPRHPDPWLNRSREDRDAWMRTMPDTDDDLMDVVEF